MRQTGNRGRIVMAGLCCGVLAASALEAQQPAQQDALRQRTAQTQTGQKQFCLATELIGMTVKDQGDQACGQVHNLIITREGEVQYLALSASHAGGAEGAAADQPRQNNPNPQAGRTAAATGKLILVPWELAKFHAGPTGSEGYVSIQIEKDRLMTAPSFDQQQLTAEQGQAEVIAQVDRFFNVRERRGAARPELGRDREQREQPRQEQPRRQDN